MSIRNLFKGKKSKANNSTQRRRLSLENLEERQLLAVTWVVNTAADVASWNDADDVVSLREAVNRADNGDVVTFCGQFDWSNNKINLVNGEIIVNKSLEIYAGKNVTIDANDNSRVFSVLDYSKVAQVGLYGLTLTGANGVGNGGAILNYENLTLTNCAVDGNYASTNGGAIFNSAGATLNLVNAEFAGNASGTYAGAIYNAGSLNLINVTVAGNKSAFAGGIYSVGKIGANNTIVTNNFASSNWANYNGLFTTDSANNQFGADAGFVEAPVFDAKGVLVNADTMNLSLAKGSVSIDAGNNDKAINKYDLAGNARIYNNIVDIGAYEFNNATPSGNITIDGYEGVCDGKVHGVTINGLQNGDVVSYSEDGKNWQANEITYSEAGNYTVYVKVERANYSDFIGSGDIVLSPYTSLTVIWEGVNKSDTYVYDYNVDYSDKIVAGYRINDVFTYLDVTFVNENGDTTFQNAGKYEITASFKSDDENSALYSLTNDIKEKTIEKAPITFTYDMISSYFDKTNEAYKTNINGKMWDGSSDATINVNFDKVSDANACVWEGVFEKDKNGEFVLDENGKKIPVLDEDGNPVRPCDDVYINASGYYFRTDFVLDENEERIQMVDENGDPIFDENANPVFETVDSKTADVGNWGVKGTFTLSGASAGNYVLVNPDDNTKILEEGEEIVLGGGPLNDGAYEITEKAVQVAVVFSNTAPTENVFVPGEKGLPPVSQTVFYTNETIENGVADDIYIQIWVKNWDNANLKGNINEILGGYVDLNYASENLEYIEVIDSTLFPQNTNVYEDSVDGKIRMMGGLKTEFKGGESANSEWVLLTLAKFKASSVGEDISISVEDPTYGSPFEYEDNNIARMYDSVIPSFAIDYDAPFGYGVGTISIYSEKLAAPVAHVLPVGLTNVEVSWGKVEKASGYTLQIESYVQDKDGNWKAEWSTIAENIADRAFTFNVSEYVKADGTNYTYGDTYKLQIQSVGDGSLYEDSDFGAIINVEGRELKVNPMDVDGDGRIGPSDRTALSDFWMSIKGKTNWEDANFENGAWKNVAGKNCNLDGNLSVGPSDSAYLSSNWMKSEKDWVYPAARADLADASFDDMDDADFASAGVDVDIDVEF